MDVTANYTVTPVNNTSGVITAKTLFASGLSAANKTYDATTAAILSGTAALLSAEAAGSSTTDGKPYTGDTVSLTSTASSAFTGTFSSKDVANGIVVKVTGNSLTGAQASDYALSSTDEENGAVTANIRTLAEGFDGDRDLGQQQDLQRHHFGDVDGHGGLANAGLLIVPERFQAGRAAPALVAVAGGSILDAVGSVAVRAVHARPCRASANISIPI